MFLMVLAESKGNFNRSSNSLTALRFPQCQIRDHWRAKQRQSSRWRGFDQPVSRNHQQGTQLACQILSRVGPRSRFESRIAVHLALTEIASISDAERRRWCETGLKQAWQFPYRTRAGASTSHSLLRCSAALDVEFLPRLAEICSEKEQSRHPRPRLL